MRVIACKPEKRFKRLKSKQQLQFLSANTTDVFDYNIFDYYYARPESLENLVHSLIQSFKANPQNKAGYLYLKTFSLLNVPNLQQLGLQNLPMEQTIIIMHFYNCTCLIEMMKI